VERRVAAVLDRAAALGPEPVGDRARELAFARDARADEAQEARARRLVHVEQRQREPVDWLAVPQRRVVLAVGSTIESPAGSSASGSEGRGSTARSPSAATSSNCRSAAVIALMRGALFEMCEDHRPRPRAVAEVRDRGMRGLAA
jgi:hypothetical protein